MLPSQFIEGIFVIHEEGGGGCRVQGLMPGGDHF